MRQLFPGSEHILLVGMGVIIFSLLAVSYGRHQDTFTAKLYRITLYNQKKSASVLGFLDTGNMLTDPFVEKPVNLVSKNWFEALFGKEFQKRLIPYLALGKEDGLIETVTIDSMEIKNGSKTIAITPAVLGLAEDIIFAHGDYEVLMNGKLWNSIEKIEWDGK